MTGTHLAPVADQLRVMPEYKTKALDQTTWPDFERLVEANNGVWGGCWCMWYHRKDKGESPEAKRKAKQCLVRDGQAHASLVYDNKDCDGFKRSRLIEKHKWVVTRTVRAQR